MIKHSSTTLYLNLLNQDKVKLALEQAIEDQQFVSDSEAYVELNHQLGRVNYLLNQKRKGLIGSSDYEVRRNEIRVAMLNFFVNWGDKPNHSQKTETHKCRTKAAQGKKSPPIRLSTHDMVMAKQISDFFNPETLDFIGSFSRKNLAHEWSFAYIQELQSFCKKFHPKSRKFENGDLNQLLLQVIRLIEQHLHRVEAIISSGELGPMDKNGIYHPIEYARMRSQAHEKANTISAIYFIHDSFMEFYRLLDDLRQRLKLIHGQKPA